MRAGDIHANSGRTVSVSDNLLLARLRPDDMAFLAPYLAVEHHPQNHILYKPGDSVGTVYFPRGPTLVSFVVELDEEHSVETMLVGHEGAVGGIVSEGQLPAYSRIMVQSSGDFFALPVTMLNEAKAKSPALHAMFARYADCLLAQIFQSTACNAVHSVEQRICKWIIAAIDRSGGEVVPMTQERLAALLGVGRSYVTRLIGDLKRQGLLEVSRGRLRLANKAGVQSCSCNCNEQVKDHYDKVMGAIYDR